MRSFLKTLLIAAVAALCIAGSDAATAAKIADHPAVTPYPGSTLTRRDDLGHAPYNVVVGLNAAGAAGDGALSTLAPEGTLTRLAYENAKDKSADEVFANYEEGLRAGGYEVLFSCQGSSCGSGAVLNQWIRTTGLRYVSADMRYLSARHSSGGRDIYIAVLVAKLRHQIDVLEVAEMARGLVTAQALSDGLLVNGRAVLDGILFDTDKTTLKPESKEALDVIAAFLAERPALKVYIVGHTDSVGSFEHNMSLSKGRAAAVVKALRQDYGIAEDRLSAHGVGPLAPAKTNAGDDGRTQNRRVEMVER